DGNARIGLAVEDRDRDLLLGELVMLHLEHVPRVRDDAVDELGVLAREPIREERALAVPVEIDLVDREAASKEAVEPRDLIAILFSLDEVERAALARSQTIGRDDDVAAAELAVADRIVPERPTPVEPGPVEHDDEVWGLARVDLLRQAIPIGSPLGGHPLEGLSFLRARRRRDDGHLAELLRRERGGAGEENGERKETHVGRESADGAMHATHGDLGCGRRTPTRLGSLPVARSPRRRRLDLDPLSPIPRTASTSGFGIGLQAAHDSSEKAGPARSVSVYSEASSPRPGRESEGQSPGSSGSRGVSSSACAHEAGGSGDRSRSPS